MSKDQLVETYREKHPASAGLHQRARDVFAGDGATAFVRMLDPYRPYITHAKGSKKWDVDGNEYIDYVMGHGALLLGHSHPAIVAAVQEQVAKGVHFGDNHLLEVELAERIKSLLPSAERVAFFSCGQEANLMAIRISRIFTGRRKILRFVENFHGWADEVAWPPTAPGVVADAVTIVPYDLDRVEEELATEQYAIVMTEGGGAHMSGQVPIDTDFVQALPDLVHKYGSVWHMDEVVTGFRDTVGGFQTLVGVKPDLTSLGKIIGGGLGIGALAGRADIMEPFSATAPDDARVRHSGTWNANPLTCAAGLAACEIYRTGEPQKRANELAAQFRQGANRALRQKGVEAWLYGRSVTHIYFGPIDFEPPDGASPPTRDVEKIVGMVPAKVRVGHHLLQRGVAILGGWLFVFSAAHDEEDVAKTLTAFSDSIDAMLVEGALDGA
jgi:glutamate-1-semialdehyde 2,1-aminomutase